jgi:hypothetical protein
MKVIYHYTTALLTICLCTVSAWFTLRGTMGLHFGIALSCHLLAVGAAWLSARMRRGAPLDITERDAVVIAGLVVPWLGPAMAIGLPRRAGTKAGENAHEAMERYKEHVRPRIPEYERSLFTGDFDRDLARKLDLESYREVLHHGETDQKRSALFRLAELGQPHHLALIRSCLEDKDGEVRLYAYGELERLMRGHEDLVAKGRAKVAQDPNHEEAHLNLARAHFGLASSGVLDRATAGFHMRVAAQSAVDARNCNNESVAAVTLEASAYAHVGEFDRATAVLESLSRELSIHPEVIAAQAEIAFVARDFPRAREEAERLKATGTDLPGWLEALLVGNEEAEPEEQREEATA